MLKKFPLDKISGTENALLFLSRALNHHRFAFNLRFVSLKLCMGFSIFDSVLFLLKFMDSLTLKRNNSFQD